MSSGDTHVWMNENYIMGEIITERIRQIDEGGREPEDDDLKTPLGWRDLISKHLYATLSPALPHRRRESFIKIAALAMAAVAAHDRRERMHS